MGYKQEDIYMSSKGAMFKRGFKAVKDEEKRREENKKKFAGKLWRIYFPSDAKPDYEIPWVFLTNEPINFWQHNIMEYGKFSNATCTQDDNCKYCNKGEKPQFVGAFLGVDLRPYERDAKDSKGTKTGKKETVSESIRLLVRGTTDLAKLDRLESKYGLLDKQWSIAKTGKDTTTTCNFDRGEELDYSEKEIMALLPDSLREIVKASSSFREGLFEIVEAQITAPEEEEDVPEEKTTKTSHHIRKVDEEEDTAEVEEKPKKATEAVKSEKAKQKKLLKRS